MLKSTPLPVEPRLQILQAAQRGASSEVEVLLKNDPSLIHAKSTSKQYSLLHIAAARNNQDLCRMLLQYGHQTNPIDIDGKTPYQQTTSSEVKTTLINAHMRYLRQRFFTSDQIPTPIKRLDQSFEREVFVLSKKEFESHPLTAEMDASAAGLTALSPPEPRTKTQTLLILFRADILMIPHYGELLVIHENEQAIQFLEEFAKSKTGFMEGEDFPRGEITRFEARSYIKFAASAFEFFPFLREYPRVGDSPDIVEAKKLFIVMGLVGLVGYLNQCTPKQIELLHQLPHYSEVIEHATNTISKKNIAINEALLAEITSKYLTPEAAPSARSPAAP